MDNAAFMCALLLPLLASAIGIGAGLVAFVIRRKRLNAAPVAAQARPGPPFSTPSALGTRPPRWLAVKSRRLSAVQNALGLHNTKPCSWSEGLADEHKLFIAPAIKGWILVFGSGLPDPDDDIDACFRFLVRLSRKLGRVQFFSANRVLQHHAWACLRSGRVVRAYAWAGKTLWAQGRVTAAEKELRLQFLDYGEPAERISLGDTIAANVEKIPSLAAHWSLDPARIEERFLAEERGIVGVPSLRF